MLAQLRYWIRCPNPKLLDGEFVAVRAPPSTVVNAIADTASGLASFPGDVPMQYAVSSLAARSPSLPSSTGKTQ
jgi:hypothetical protein